MAVEIEVDSVIFISHEGGGEILFTSRKAMGSTMIFPTKKVIQNISLGEFSTYKSWQHEQGYE